MSEASVNMELVAQRLILKEKRVEYWEAHHALPKPGEIEEEAFLYLREPFDKRLFV
jgi:hypothetical protein